MDTVKELAKKIWEYHHLGHRLEKTDAIFILCSHDIRVAEYAASLFLKGYAPLLLCSGGIAHKGDLVESPWNMPEADVFADRVMALGVPKESIIIERNAQNCGENVRFTEAILNEKNIVIDSLIAVQKPYMERRTYATIAKHWPHKKIIVTSPPIPFERYATADIPLDDVINIMVGDLQRIKVYPKKGFQIEQDIPHDVWKAYEGLVALGYTKHLVKDI